MDNRFKVGDKVYIARITDSEITYYKVGDVFTIDTVDFRFANMGDNMNYRGKRITDSLNVWLNTDDVEAYKEKEEKKVQYHVGQKVRLKETFGSLNKGDITEITHVDKSNSKIPVKIRVSDGYNAWIDPRRFELLSIKHPVIVITTDGKETKARLMEGKKTIKEETAVCREGDKFNFLTGALIAVFKLWMKSEHN